MAYIFNVNILQQTSFVRKSRVCCYMTHNKHKGVSSEQLFDLSASNEVLETLTDRLVVTP